MKAAVQSRQIIWATVLLVVLVQLSVMYGIHLLSIQLGQGGFYPIVLGGDDGKFHYAVAKYMVSSNQYGGNFDLLDVSIWPTVMAVFMKFTGSDEILLIKQMLLFGRLLTIASALLALEGLRKGNAVPDNPKAVLWSRVALLLLVGLFPSGMFYSFGSLYRDALIYAFHLTTVALVLHTITDRRPGAQLTFFLLSLPCLFALYELRNYAAYSIVLATAGWFVARGIRRIAKLRSPDRHRQNRTVWIAMAVLIALAVPVLWNTSTVQQIIWFRDSYLLMAGSNLRISFTGKNPIQAAPLYAYSWISNVIGPLFWQVRTVSNLLSFILEIPFLSYVGYGVWRRRSSITPACSFLIAQAAVWFSLISFTNDNLGTAGRLRVLGWHCLIVVFAYLVPRAKEIIPARFLRSRTLVPA